MDRFRNQVVWITGASAGLGAEMARQFAAEGARLVLSARRSDRLEALVRECDALGGQARALPLDVTNDTDVAAAARSLAAHEGRVDVAIANAGFGVTGAFAKLTTDDWRRQFEVNLMGVVNVARESLGLLGKSGCASVATSAKANRATNNPVDNVTNSASNHSVSHPGSAGADAAIDRSLAANSGDANAPRLPTAKPHTRGRLVLISSVAAFMPGPGVAPYSASKAAVRSLVQSLALELHATGISVTGIYPGFVESEIRQVDNRGQYDAANPDRGPHKLYWPTDRAARVMLRAIYKRKREFVFTAHGKLGAWLGRHIPGLVHFLMKHGRKR